VTQPRAQFESAEPGQPQARLEGARQPLSAGAADDLRPHSITHAISVIIPTKNRPGDLEQVFRSVVQQSVPVAQLIIVDQSATEEGGCRIDRLYRDAPAEVRDRMQLCFISATLG